MLDFLQRNAEWMCAIAITFFTAVQIGLYITQIKQELRLKRLNLVQKLEYLCKDVPSNKEEAKIIVSFLNANKSLFITLLNRKDILHFNKFYKLVYLLTTDTPYLIQNVPEHVKVFLSYMDSLSSVLCNANYGLCKYNLNNPFGDEKG